MFHNGITPRDYCVCEILPCLSYPKYFTKPRVHKLSHKWKRKYTNMENQDTFSGLKVNFRSYGTLVNFISF